MSRVKFPSIRRKDMHKAFVSFLVHVSLGTINSSTYTNYGYVTVPTGTVPTGIALRQALPLGIIVP